MVGSIFLVDWSYICWSGLAMTLGVIFGTMTGFSRLYLNRLRSDPWGFALALSKNTVRPFSSTKVI